jgi:hypothetical protein
VNQVGMVSSGKEKVLSFYRGKYTRVFLMDHCRTSS